MLLVSRDNLMAWCLSFFPSPGLTIPIWTIGQGLEWVISNSDDKSSEATFTRSHEEEEEAEMMCLFLKWYPPPWPLVSCWHWPQVITQSPHHHTPTSPDYNHQFPGNHILTLSGELDHFLPSFSPSLSLTPPNLHFFPSLPPSPSFPPFLPGIVMNLGLAQLCTCHWSVCVLSCNVKILLLYSERWTLKTRSKVQNGPLNFRHQRDPPQLLTGKVWWKRLYLILALNGGKSFNQ